MTWQTMRKYPWYYMALLIALFFLIWHGMLHFEEHQLKKKMSQLSSQSLTAIFSQMEQEMTLIADLQRFYQTISLNAQDKVWINQLNDYFKQHLSVEAVLFDAKNHDKVILTNPYLSSDPVFDIQSLCLNQKKKIASPYFSSIFMQAKGHYLCTFNENQHLVFVINISTLMQKIIKELLQNDYYLVGVNQHVVGTAVDKKQVVYYRQWFNMYGAEQYYELSPSPIYWEAKQREALLVAFLLIGGLLILLLAEAQRYLLQNPGAQDHAMELGYLHQLAFYDQLTQLPNRKYFFSELSQWLIKAREQQDYFTFCFLDCDHFKQINDRYGHLIGDRVLAYVAQTIASVIRKNDFFARVSGDEFCLLFSQCYACPAVESVAQKIMELFDEPFVFESYSIQIKVSMGLLICDDPEGVKLDEESLFECADKIMYISKKESSGYVIMSQKMDILFKDNITPLLT